jgi:OmpA-OmpF porin, OOP family
MKKVLAAFVVLCFISSISFAQNKLIRPRALGISFIMNDFTTAERIRTGTLSTVFREKQWSKFKEMSPGLALTYFKGMTPHVDFAGSFAFSSVNDPLHNDSGGDALFLEADASANIKMFDESYWVTPYLSAGIGASKFKDYYAAFLPLGLGFKVNLFDEAAFFVNTQYRVPVSEATSYHFMYSFGISGVIGK